MEVGRYKKYCELLRNSVKKTCKKTNNQWKRSGDLGSCP